jgi:hypothetical protein
VIWLLRPLLSALTLTAWVFCWLGSRVQSRRTRRGYRLYYETVAEHAALKRQIGRIAGTTGPAPALRHLGIDWRATLLARHADKSGSGYVAKTRRPRLYAIGGGAS